MARFAAIGLDHRHVYDMTEGLLAAGAECAGYDPDTTDPRVLAGFRKRFPQVPEATRACLLDDPAIDFIVLSAVPRDRAALAIEAMHRGKDVVTDKPGVTTLDQLDAVRQAVRETGRLWSVCVGRVVSPAIQEAVRVVRSGELGRLVQVLSLAPHRLNRALRPSWFFDHSAYGGIINDIGVHSIDQFLALADVTEAEIESSTIGTFGTKPEGFEDFAEITLRTPSVRGYCRVDWFTPDGLPTWGDGRLFLVGTDGTLELRKNLDIEGRAGSNHMFVAGKDGTRHVDCSDLPVTYYRDLILAVPYSGLLGAAAGASVYGVPNGPPGAGRRHPIYRGTPAVIGVAIIGLGNALAPHANSILDLRDRMRVVHAVSRNSDQRRLTSERFGFPTSSDAASAIADPRVDAVLVLTPTNSHLEVAEAAFAARKHVLCEKPLETVLERAERLVASGRRANRRLAVMLQLRFRTASQRLKALLETNALGELQAATMTVPWWRPQTYYDEPGRGVKARDGGGVLMIQAIHTLDLFRWFFGISSVEASIVRTTSLHKMESEDYATALVRLGNGAPGTITATTAAFPGSPEQITAIGSKGTARMEGGTLRVSFLDGSEILLQDTSGSGSGSGFMEFSHEPHRAVLEDFLDAIERERDPAIPGEEALATQRVIDAIINKGV